MQSLGDYGAHSKRQKAAQSRQRCAERVAPVQHYAHYHDLSGIATLRRGGYVFQPDGSPEVWTVSYQDADLVLLGRCDLADAQAALDGDLLHKARGTPPTVATVLDAVQALTDQARHAVQAHQAGGDSWAAENLAVLSTDLQRLVNRCHAVLEP
jgi:hypothetical protein